MAELRKYGSWAGNPAGSPEDITQCIKSVHSSDAWSKGHQCSRKRGHGEDGLYCKQHDPERVAARDKLRREKWDRKWALARWLRERPRALEAALKEIAKGELNDPAGYAQMILDEWKEQP